ncbi:SDR family oxidoreductase [Rhizobium sp. IBUN]|uniref:SDR family oxidoreductase n=1 Tax=Rhizobium sp. IBUN TaxID=1042326 RepID=UPI000406D678|nr:SDR family oxidoreductase [Rhizobium sp. IBUN]
MKTILVTGSSSGYGLATARHFLDEGWNVIAAMRKPNPDVLPASHRLRILALDITSEESIAAAIKAAGPIDVLVNNAGIGVVGAFEATPMKQIRKIFETNTLGTLAMTQAVIPQMRERRQGTIINVTSTVTYVSMPLAAAYTASKTAIEGFTGSVAHELAHFGVRAKLVEPGYGPTTRFTANVDVKIEDLIPAEYGSFAAPIFEAFANPPATTNESDVAQAVWAAAHDTADQLHFPAGADAVALYNARTI